MACPSSRSWLSLATCLTLVGCLPLAQHRREGASNCQPLLPSTEPVALLLTPGDVLKMSVKGSGAGNALEEEAKGQKGERCLTCSARRKQSKLKAELQGHASDEIRNQTAGLALTAYYRLAEAHAQLGLLLQGIRPLEALIAQADELKRQGLPVPEESNSLRQQRSKAEAERVKLILLGEKLNEQLTQLVGKAACLPPGAVAKITTIEVFPVEELSLDECEEVEIGLKYRPDLNLLRAAICGLDAGTLPVIHQVLMGVNSLMGGKINRCIPFVECVPLFLPGLSEKEVKKARKQLEAMLEDRTRQAVSEIRQAVRGIHAEQQLIRLAREREAMAQSKLNEAEENARQKIGKSTTAPLARRDLIQSQSDVVHEVIEWEIARVNLRKAQGLLIRDAVKLAQEACDAQEIRATAEPGERAESVHREPPARVESAR